MALVVNRSDLFPPGTVVAAYALTGAEQHAGFTRSGEPKGTKAGEGTVTAAGQLSIGALADGVQYVLWASVSGTDRYLQVTGDRGAAGKIVTLALGSCGSVAGVETAAEFLWRTLINLPVETARWRLRMRNFNSSTVEEAGSAAALTSVYKGSPLANAGRWKGAFKSAPAAVLGATAVGTSEDSVTPWVESTSGQFLAYTPAALSVGFTKTAGKWFLDELAGPTWGAAGASAAAQVGETGVPGGLGAANGLVPFDIRLEYEYVPASRGVVANLVGLVIGDSIAGGHALTDGGCYPGHESWPAVAGLRQGHPIIFSGSPGATSSSFNSLSSFRWTRLNLASTIPNYAIVALGVNDAGSSVALATYEANILGLVEKLTGLGIPNVYLATTIPVNFPEAKEKLRVEYNTWIRTMPGNVAGVIDLDKQLALQATPAVVDPAWGVNSEANPHVLRGAYQRMAGALILP